MVENVLDDATAHQYRDASNPARWRGHLDQLLARPSKVKTVEHHPAMPYARLPELLFELASQASMSALALQWLILTATRTGETIGARWEEIDQAAAIWTIPAVRMKARREHRVPLTGAVLEILARLPRLDGHLYLFPGARHGKPVSNMALLQLMRGMGYGVGGNRGAYVPHGFRSSFRDWAGEVSRFPREIAEAALAQVLENKVEAAYQRGDLLLKRRKLMEAWADWCIKPSCKASALQTGIDPRENADYLTQINFALPYREVRYFLALYQENRRHSIARSLDASPVASAVRTLAESEAQALVFEGTMGKLLERLNEHRDGADAWPKSARGLGDALRRQRPALAQIGLQVEIGKAGRNGVMVTIRQREHRERGERHSEVFTPEKNNGPMVEIEL